MHSTLAERGRKKGDPSQTIIPTQTNKGIHIHVHGAYKTQDENMRKIGTCFENWGGGLKSI